MSLRNIDPRSPILSAAEYGLACFLQGRTLDCGATPEARRAYQLAQEAEIDLDRRLTDQDVTRLLDAL